MPLPRIVSAMKMAGNRPDKCHPVLCVSRKLQAHQGSSLDESFLVVDAKQCDRNFLPSHGSVVKDFICPATVRSYLWILKTKLRGIGIIISQLKSDMADDTPERP